MDMRDFRKNNVPVKSAIQKRIEADQLAIKCLLYRAKLEELETMAITEDVVGNIEFDERSIEYEDPTETKILFLPFEFERLKGAIDGTSSIEGQTSDGMNVEVKALISDDNVPMQSIIQFDEVTDSHSGADRRTITLYVAGFENSGQAPTVVTRYLLIPFQNDGRV